MKTVGNEMTILHIEQFQEPGMYAVFSFKLKIMKNLREYELSGGMIISMNHPCKKCPIIYINKDNSNYLYRIMK